MTSNNICSGLVRSPCNSRCRPPRLGPRSARTCATIARALRATRSERRVKYKRRASCPTSFIAPTLASLGARGRGHWKDRRLFDRMAMCLCYTGEPCTCPSERRPGPSATPLCGWSMTPGSVLPMAAGQIGTTTTQDGEEEKQPHNGVELHPDCSAEHERFADQLKEALAKAFCSYPLLASSFPTIPRVPTELVVEACPPARAMSLLPPSAPAPHQLELVTILPVASRPWRHQRRQLWAASTACESCIHS